MERIHDDVRGVFSQVPRRGAETGGILLGRREGDEIRIVDFEPVPSEHRFGRLYKLSEADVQMLVDTLKWVRGGGHPDLSAVGFYRGLAQPEFGLNEDEEEFMRAHFQEQERLLLLIQPAMSRPSVADFFFWQNNRMQQAFRPLNFPFASMDEPELPAPPVRPAANESPAPERPSPEKPEKPVEPEWVRPTTIHGGVLRVPMPVRHASSALDVTLDDPRAPGAEGLHAGESRRVLGKAAEPVAPVEAPEPLPQPPPRPATIRKPVPLTPAQHRPSVMAPEPEIPGSPAPTPPRRVLPPAPVRVRQLPREEETKPPNREWVRSLFAAMLAAGGITLAYFALKEPPTELPRPAAAVASSEQKVTSPATVPQPAAAPPAKPTPLPEAKELQTPPEPPVPDTVAVRAVLDRFASAMRSGDLDAAAECYAPTVGLYRNRRNVPRSEVRRNLLAAFGAANRMDIYRLENLAITRTAPDEAVATFRARWQTAGYRKTVGQSRERLTLHRNQGRWQIVVQTDEDLPSRGTETAQNR